MKKQFISIQGIPAILWGTTADKLCIYVHGQGGNKEEAITLADRLCPYGCQILSIDLPTHGSRQAEAIPLVPWTVVPELACIMSYSQENWPEISLFANSIGAWFSMLSLKDAPLQNCLFVSPILDMELLISDLMASANISEAQLQQAGQLPTACGHILDWNYWLYVKKHPITKWDVPTKILYGTADHLTSPDTLRNFSQRFNCMVTVMEKGEHWFHTQQQLDFLNKWLINNFC